MNTNENKTAHLKPFVKKQYSFDMAQVDALKSTETAPKLVSNVDENFFDIMWFEWLGYPKKE